MFVWNIFMVEWIYLNEVELFQCYLNTWQKKFLVRIIWVYWDNADQFSFLEIKSLQTALTGDHLLVGWRPMWGRLPQCLSRFLVVSSVLKKMCLPFSDSCRPPRGLRANRGVRDTGAVTRAQFLCRAAESEARLGRVNLGAGFPGYLHSPPLTA